MLYMDLDKLFDKKNITASSKNLYMKNLARLNGGKPIKNMYRNEAPISFYTLDVSLKPT